MKCTFPYRRTDSHAGSSTGGPDWGTMGGTVGDGFLQQGAAAAAGGGGGGGGQPAASPYIVAPPQATS